MPALVSRDCTSDSNSAMSEESVEVVQRALDAYGRFDRAGVEPLLHPDALEAAGLRE